MADLEFAGESFKLASKVGLMPLMKFAHIARKGVDANEMEGLAALYDILAQVIADEDWARFEEAAVRSHADGDDLLPLVKGAMARISERPTSEPSDSSDGPTSTSGSSADGSSSAVIARLEQQGRPSIAYMVQQADRARLSSVSA